MTIIYEIEDFSTLDRRKMFLRGAFGKDWEEKAFLVNEPEWGKRLRLEELDDTRGCFWSVGAIPWGKTRRLENVENVRALVLDDVGTKIDTGSAMMLFHKDDGKEHGPTAIVGTSEGNYQYIYNFENPPPAVAFNQYRRALLADLQGAVDGKDAVHLFRLPWGINRKKGRNNFRVNGRIGRWDGHVAKPLDVDHILAAAREAKQ